MRSKFEPGPQPSRSLLFSEGTENSSPRIGRVHTRQLDSDAQDSSAPDGGNFRKGLQIDMKDLVGDAVGNVSACSSFYLLSLTAASDEYQSGVSRCSLSSVCYRGFSA